MKKLISGFFVFLTVLCILNVQVYASNTNEPSSESIRAKVIDIISKEKQSEKMGDEYLITKVEQIKIRILEGQHKDEIIPIMNYINDSRQDNIHYEKNDEIFITIEEDNNGHISGANIYQFSREKYLKYLALFFMILMIIIGRSKGIKAIITLAITIYLVIEVFLKFIIKGYNPFIISIVVCIAITVITLVIISGLNKKTLAAIIGTTSGVILAELIAFIVGNFSKIRGVGSEESQMLMYSKLSTTLNFKNVFFATVLIGALGAVMDVSMSIASAMNEIKEANRSITKRELMKAGMSVGRDVMGTMANTLILAYCSASVYIIILGMVNNIGLIEMINQDAIACEIIRALSGSIGLIFTIPITVLAACELE